MIVPALLSGSTAGFGLWLIVRGLAPPPPPLESAIAEMHRPRWTTAEPSRGSARTTRAARAARMIAGFGTSTSARQNLNLIERSDERHALDKLTYGLLGASLPMLSSVIMAAGGVALAPTVVVVSTVLLGLGGLLLPEQILQTEARRYRSDFIGQLAVFLDLVVVLLAGGRGVESALGSAATMGDGIAFVRLRRTLESAQLNRRSPWAELERLAIDTDISALAELSASATLAGEAGARVRESLEAKAHAIRSRLLAEAEAEAHRRSETMSGPVVMMLTGFVVLIGFPAVHALLTF